MKCTIPGWIAWRYLIRKKSRGAVGILTVIALCGIAVATAAIICVLSVFNGFRVLLSERNPGLRPDIEVAPAKGKTIESPDSVIRVINGAGYNTKGVIPIVRDNALAVSEGREMPVTVMGVDYNSYPALAGISRYIYPGGKFSIGPVITTANADAKAPEDFSEEDILNEIYAGEEKENVTISAGIAASLGLRSGNTGLTVFTPSRTRTINPANPSGSFQMEETEIAGIFSTKNEEFDRDLLFCDIDMARRLFEYDSEASRLYIWLQNQAEAPALADKLQSVLGQGFTVRDRARLDEVSFRMVQIEKWVTFLLLAFILMIAFFNVISSLSILVTDKTENLLTLRMLGMTERNTAGIFTAESIIVSLLGGFAGIGLGALLCFVQARFGLIRLNGNEENLIVSRYPVELQLPDILGTLILVLILGTVTAIIISSYTRRKLRTVQTP